MPPTITHGTTASVTPPEFTVRPVWPDVLLRLDVGRDRVRELLLFLRLAEVDEREVEVSGQRARFAGEPREGGLGFAELRFGEGGEQRTHACDELRVLEFEPGFSRDGLFACLEVFPNANAAEQTIDAPRDHTVAIVEAADGEFSLFHA